MNRILLLFVILSLNGCIDGDPPSPASQADRVYTVEEFLAQPELRQRFFTMCGNNPGQSERDPNCINVLSAERIAASGAVTPRIAP